MQNFNLPEQIKILSQKNSRDMNIILFLMLFTNLKQFLDSISMKQVTTYFKKMTYQQNWALDWEMTAKIKADFSISDLSISSHKNF